MEFFIPILFAVFKKGLAAILASLMLFTALRIADKRSGIYFKDVWEKADAHNKIRYLCMRHICYTLLFVFTFTLA